VDRWVPLLGDVCACKWVIPTPQGGRRTDRQ
jgi:hypothetical protein